ncbi:thiamine pyrophosphate-dependent dehydrogenase E1 component subunit alpha [Demequina flava]|uniref:thiamine pyrophosphate-dependent dehydrogenase E1 component subunit alpha n=1 Tax=Demequina flava TaxID=1095025 RepID=UPI000780CE15|nr:thiamine pyrophosphate-dependent dehydrogenase E1 component subunit alpha [Demequina flava]
MDSTGPLSTDGLVSMLTHEGVPVEHETFSRYVQNLDAEELRQMWRAMTVVRAWDLEATSLQRQGELGLWVQSLGQEGAQIGSGRALRDNDFVFPSYREHGVAHLQGVDLVEVLRIFRGLQHGAWTPAEHNFHLYTLVIGAHSLHATGYAMAKAREQKANPEQEPGAVVAYFGDGATSQGDVNESLIFASVYNAPIVFFCQNNQYAISESVTRQTKVPLADRGRGVGMPTIRVDGNDVIACRAVTEWALDHARSGKGPVFIEALTYRMGAHTTSDDPTRYRDKEEEQYWADRDPIARLDTYLSARGELSDEFREDVAQEAKALGERARSTVKSWKRPPLLDMFKDVYALPHAAVDAERVWFERFQESFDTEEAGR